MALSFLRMLFKRLFFLLLFVKTINGFTQKTLADTLSNPDSLYVLQEVVVKGYESNKSLLQTAAAIGIIQPKNITRFENTTLLNAFLPLPGVRMEERSPGSYRISIRGSSVRSPFGVRNVKVYWNDIPLSDANGITYFNLLDMSTIRSIEVLKGPAGSMYGASTGGVLLLKTQTGEASTNTWGKLNAQLLFGQYATRNLNATYSYVNQKINTAITYAHLQSDGYRIHSAMQREVFSLRSSFEYHPKATLNVLINYSAIDYQTPGGLTLEQLNENPRQARPATRFTPSAIEQQAGIKQNYLLMGLSNEWQINNNWKNTTAFFMNNSQLENPFITNYEIRSEQSAGGRSTFSFEKNKENIKINSHVGVEWIYTGSTFDSYDNLLGKIGHQQAEEAVKAVQGFLFGQLDFTLPQQWFFTIGGSLNQQNYQYNRRSDAPNQLIVNDKVSVPFSPRIAVLKQFNKQFSIYGSLSRGFSSPTVQEFVAGYLPNHTFKTVAAEVGKNIEVGFRKFMLHHRIFIDVSAYTMQLRNTIVRRLDENEKERFTNAGKTQQNGLEAYISANIVQSDLLNLSCFTSYTLADFHYVDYQLLNDNFSGNVIPSVPKHSFSSGIDVTHHRGFYGSIIANFTDKIYLNDANSASANAYWLVNARLGWQIKRTQQLYKIYVGGENLLNQSYSLGNDTNAFGNRFYNPAAKRNFNFGFSITI